jgi:2-oxoglutarate dehydrogenase complex dehydrogenase (E1) component-like enzyme
MTPVARLYEQELLDNGTTNPEQVARMKKKINDKLEDSYQKSKTYTFKAEDWVT